MLSNRRLSLLLAICVTILGLSRIAAQDATPINPPTETSIPTLLPTEIPTDLPSALWVTADDRLIVGDRKLTYIKGERITDLQLGYEFGSGPVKGLSLLFQINNLGKTEYVRYKDDPSNEVERTKYGRQYLFGLNYKL